MNQTASDKIDRIAVYKLGLCWQSHHKPNLPPRSAGCMNQTASDKIDRIAVYKLGLCWQSHHKPNPRLCPRPSGAPLGCPRTRSLDTRKKRGLLPRNHSGNRHTPLSPIGAGCMIRASLLTRAVIRPQNSGSDTAITHPPPGKRGG